MAAVTICSDLGDQKNWVCCCFPIYLLWSDGTGCHDLRFLNVVLSQLFHSLLSLSSTSLSAIRVVSFAYLRLLVFLLAILIPACTSSSPAFLMMYSAYKLNNLQGDNVQPWCTPFLIWNQSVVPCLLSCWGFSALGHGVSPHSCCSTVQPILFFTICKLYLKKGKMWTSGECSPFPLLTNKQIKIQRKHTYGVSDGKESTCNAGDPGSILESPWRREWQPTPVFLPGESHGQRRVVGYSP